VPILFRFSDVGDLVFEIEGIALYTPAQWTLGGAWRADGLTVTADLTWARWSQAPSPAADVRATLDDAGIDPEQEDPSLLLDLETLDVSAGCVDTVQPRVGAQWRWSERWSSLAGYTLRPTPVPRQVGYTNWMDAASHQLSLGALWRVREGTQVQSTAQWTALQERQARKVEARDLLGLGDTRAWGWFWSLGVQINQRL
jgi:long-subunit fatty acid transport protein